MNHSQRPRGLLPCHSSGSFHAMATDFTAWVLVPRLPFGSFTQVFRSSRNPPSMPLETNSTVSHSLQVAVISPYLSLSSRACSTSLLASLGGVDRDRCPVLSTRTSMSKYASSFSE